jgi:CRP/FNR family transcriptional regulator, cyclic AMP receptor protein
VLSEAGAVRLLDVEPELGEWLRPAERADARRFAVPTLSASTGTWTPPAALVHALCGIILEGVLVRTSSAFGRSEVGLAGPGDVVDGRLLAARGVSWRALVPVRVGLLDQRFLVAARRWPALMTGITRRLLDGQEEQRTRAAICTMPRVEERLLALLCHLACRWGRVTPAGVSLAVPMTHELLGGLVGARRPTVTLAITALREEGLLERRADGTWLLPRGCPEWPSAGVPGLRRPLAA